MKISVISFTQTGVALATKLAVKLPDTSAYSMKITDENTQVQLVEESVKLWAKERFKQGDCLIFIGAVGIAVRAIAPYVQSKTTDPAVIAIDEKGEYVIPLLSGHIGGANEMAIKVAEAIGATPIVTTATDLNQVFAVDTWAQKEGYYLVNPAQIKNVSATLLKGEEVGLVSEFPVSGDLPKDIVEQSGFASGIVVGDHPTALFQNSLFLKPKRYVLGVGCRKNIDSEVFEKAILESLAENKIDINAVSEIVSIDIKKNEKAILEFAEKYRLKFLTFSAAELQNAKGSFAVSNFVQSTTGVDNVCERACSLQAPELVVKKQMLGGVTLAVSRKAWTVKF